MTESPLEAVVDPPVTRAGSPPLGAAVLVVDEVPVCTGPKVSIGLETGAGRTMLSSPATAGGVVNTTGGDVITGGVITGGVMTGGVIAGGVIAGGVITGGMIAGGVAVKVSAIALPAAWVNT